MSKNAHTIVAVSSAPGESLRGLIRLSGPESTTIVQKMGATLPPPRQLTATRLTHHNRPLPCLILHFRGPGSYTGQDIVELQLLGNPVLLDQLIQRIIELGARMADPGEFTFKAYLAGKLDLTQAEGISATITATSEAQLQAAKLLRQGNLGIFSHKIVSELSTVLALVEAGIDFTDQEDVIAITPAQLLNRLHDIHVQLDELLTNSRSWSALEALPRVVLAGPPSSGKSTLFNALLGHQRAVTHPTAGTTRDLLAEPLILQRTDGSRVEIMLMDIAGLDDAVNQLDTHIQQAARQAVEQADLIIHHGKTQLASHIISIAPKADAPDFQMPDDPEILPISAHTGMGVKQLKEKILARLGNRGVSIQAQKLALQPRHQIALTHARQALNDALRQVKPQKDNPSLNDMEIIAAPLRYALDELASLGGQMTPDDIIGRVFETFCVGK